MIADNQFFYIQADLSSLSIHFFKLTYGKTSTDWSNIIRGTSVSITVLGSESLLSQDKSKIYCIFIFGNSSPNYMHMATFEASSGRVIDSRYKSSISLDYVYGSALNGNYLIVTAKDSMISKNYLVLFNLITSTFIIKESTYGFFG